MSKFDSEFSFFDALCEVRSTMLNLIAANYIINDGHDSNKLFQLVGKELSVAYDFSAELFNLTIDELYELGFAHDPSFEGELVVMPLWLYPFVPHGTLMVDVNRDGFSVGDDIPEVYHDFWVNFGFFPLTPDDE